MNKQIVRSGVAGGAVAVSGLALATSVVDYTTLMTAVTTEITAAITAALVVVALLWGARIGLRFARSLLK